MSRNAFENNTPEITQESLGDVDYTLYTVLPPLPEGQRYELKTIGVRDIIVVKQG